MNKKGNALINVLALCIVIGLIITSFVLVTSPKFKIQDEITMDGTSIGNNGDVVNPDTPGVQKKVLKINIKNTKGNKINSFSIRDETVGTNISAKKLNEDPVTKLKTYEFTAGHKYIFFNNEYLPTEIVVTQSTLKKSEIKITLNPIDNSMKDDYTITSTNLGSKFTVRHKDFPGQIIKKNDAGGTYTLVKGSEYEIRPNDDNYQSIFINITDQTPKQLSLTFKLKGSETQKPYTINISNAKSIKVVNSITQVPVIATGNLYYLEDQTEYTIYSTINSEYYEPIKYTTNYSLDGGSIVDIFKKYFTLQVKKDDQIINNTDYIVSEMISGEKTKLEIANGRANTFALTETNEYIVEATGPNAKAYEPTVISLDLFTDPTKLVKVPIIKSSYQVHAYPKGSPSENIPITKIEDENGSIVESFESAGITYFKLKIGKNSTGKFTVYTEKFLPSELILDGSSFENDIIPVELNNGFVIRATDEQNQKHRFNIYNNYTNEQIFATGKYEVTGEDVYELLPNTQYKIVSREQGSSNLTFEFSVLPNENHILNYTLINQASYYKIEVTNPILFDVLQINGGTIIPKGNLYNLDPKEQYIIVPTKEYKLKGYSVPSNEFYPDDLAVGEDNLIKLTLERVYSVTTNIDHRASITDTHLKTVLDVYNITDNINKQSGFTPEQGSIKLTPGKEFKLSDVTSLEKWNDKHYIPLVITPHDGGENILNLKFFNNYEIKITNLDCPPFEVYKDEFRDTLVEPNTNDNRYVLSSSDKYYIKFTNNPNNRFLDKYHIPLTSESSSTIKMTLAENYTVKMFELDTQLTVTDVIGDYSTKLQGTNLYQMIPGNTYTVKGQRNDSTEVQYQLKLTESDGDKKNNNLITIYVGDAYEVNLTNNIPYEILKTTDNVSWERVKHTGNKFLLENNSSITYKIKAVDEKAGYIPIDFKVNEDPNAAKPLEFTLYREYIIKPTKADGKPIKEVFITLNGFLKKIDFIDNEFRQVLLPGSYQFSIPNHNIVPISVNSDTNRTINIFFQQNPFLDLGIIPNLNMDKNNTGTVNAVESYKSTEMELISSNSNNINGLLPSNFVNDQNLSLQNKFAVYIESKIGSKEFHYVNFDLTRTQEQPDFKTVVDVFEMRFGNVINIPVYKINIKFTYYLEDFVTNEYTNDDKLDKITYEVTYNRPLNEISSISSIQNDVTEFIQNYFKEVQYTLTNKKTSK